MLFLPGRRPLAVSGRFSKSKVIVMRYQSVLFFGFLLIGGAVAHSGEGMDAEERAELRLNMAEMLITSIRQTPEGKSTTRTDEALVIAEAIAKEPGLSPATIQRAKGIQIYSLWHLGRNDEAWKVFQTLDFQRPIPANAAFTMARLPQASGSREQGVVFQGTDRATQGDWPTRYGQDLAVLCAVHAPHDLGGGFGLEYDHVRGRARYASFSGLSMNLSGYMSKSAGNIINCYDQAYAVASFMRLVGLDAEIIYSDPFGLIHSVDMVGNPPIRCNNPFFKNPAYPAGIFNVPEVPAGSLFDSRSGFGNHMYVRSGGRIFDATSGFAKGTDGISGYQSSVIQAPDFTGSMPVDIRGYTGF
jgi:hypothetical protein